MASRSATSGALCRKEERALYRCFVQVDEATYARLLASRLPAPLPSYGNEPKRSRHDETHVKTWTIAQAGVFQVQWDRQKRPCLIVTQTKDHPQPGMGSVQDPTLAAMLTTLDAICRQWIHDCSQDNQVLHDCLITYQMSLGAWRRSGCFTFKAHLPTTLYLWALDANAPPPLSKPDLSPDQKAERERLYEGRRRKDMMWNLALGPDLSNTLARPVIAHDSGGGGVGGGSSSGGGGGGDGGGGNARAVVERSDDGSGGGAGSGGAGSSGAGGSGGSGSGGSGGASGDRSDTDRAVAAVTGALAEANLSASPAAPPSSVNQRWFRLPDTLQFTGGNVQAGGKCEVPPCTLMGSTVSPTVCLLHPLAKGASPSPEDELWTAEEAHQLMEAIEKLIMAGGWPLGFTTPSAHTQIYPQGGQACGPGGQAPVGFNFHLVPCLE